MAHFTSVKTMMLMCYFGISSLYCDDIPFEKIALQNAHTYEATETVLKTIPSLPKKD
jgi:hypothetical protein